MFRSTGYILDLYKIKAFIYTLIQLQLQAHSSPVLLKSSCVLRYEWEQADVEQVFSLETRKKLLAIRFMEFWKNFPVTTVEDINPKLFWKQLGVLVTSCGSWRHSLMTKVICSSKSLKILFQVSEEFSYLVAEECISLEAWS